MRNPIDTAVMSGTLWLLAATLIDALTPKELTASWSGSCWRRRSSSVPYSTT
jgi:hypothetical protein